MEDGSGRLNIRHSKADPEGKGSASAVAALKRCGPQMPSPGRRCSDSVDPHFSTRAKPLPKELVSDRGTAATVCRVGMAQDLAAHGATLAH